MTWLAIVLGLVAAGLAFLLILKRVVTRGLEAGNPTPLAPEDDPEADGRVRRP